ncbi:hypothetical protein NDU88_007024 [Pleurodeles waltl]|uniref:Uncharacterized protein n=1 Tax=Pleurodeles waltl TaxID=8319 RepID=A0AAV7TYI7_PLEWA|nr:hypothetical protein NDU88_007024 [Pleurodeles waltl]
MSAPLCRPQQDRQTASPDKHNIDLARPGQLHQTAPPLPTLQPLTPNCSFDSGVGYVMSRLPQKKLY